MSRPSCTRRTVLAATAAAALVVTGATDVLASVVVGSPGNDVSVGPDRDNAGNTFIQPPGVTTAQHLSNTDVLFGRLGDDLMSGRAGSDVLVGGEGSDILVGGPDVSTSAGSDTALGDEGDDVAVWGTGDRSETFVGDLGYDTQVVGRVQKDAAGGLRLSTWAGRQVPEVVLLDTTQSCTLTAVPAAQGVGEQYLLRIRTAGEIRATVRLRDVERVVCSSSRPGWARVADTSVSHATFTDVPEADLTGLVGAIVRP